jgi:hypothetical protein
VSLIPKNFASRDNGALARSCQLGLIMINLTNPIAEVGMTNSP